MIEKTLVVLKPDAVQRNIIGQIITIFEEATLRVTEAKMLSATGEFIRRHYPSDVEYLTNLGNKVTTSYAAAGRDVVAQYGTDDKLSIGRAILDSLVGYMTSGPVMALCIEGPNAIRAVRKLVGFTLPLDAAPGTIRARFSVDSSESADEEKRPLYNLVHASGNPEEAAYELGLWFGEAV